MAEANDVKNAFRRSLTPKEKPASEPQKTAGSQFSMICNREETVVFDRLMMVIRQKTASPVKKAEVVRILVQLAADDPTVREQVVEEIVKRQA